MLVIWLHVLESDCHYCYLHRILQQRNPGSFDILLPAYPAWPGNWLLNSEQQHHEQPWLSGCVSGLAPTKPGFSSCWYPYEPLVATGRASDQNCSYLPVKVLSTLVGTCKPLNKGTNDAKFGRTFFCDTVFVLKAVISLYQQASVCFVHSSVAWHSQQ